jgi:hypothetical protein
MLRALTQLKTARTFFLDTFFKTEEIHITETVDIDVQTGKRRLAPFVNPKNAGKVVEKGGYKTFTYKPPYVKPKDVTTAEDILKRGAGQGLYMTDPGELQARASERLTKELANLDDMITRREEWMAAQALQTGKVPVKGDGVDEEVDFLMKTTHKPTLLTTALWSAPTTATPLTNLRTWKKLIAQDSGLSATDVIMGSSAYENFLANTKEVIGTTGMLNQREIMMGRIQPTELPGGVTYLGRMDSIGLDLWTYDEWYVDDVTGEEGEMMDPKKVLMVARNGRFSKHYGAIKDLDALAPFKRFPKQWDEKDPSVRYLMVQSAPLPAPHQIDAIVCAKVLA